MTRRLRPLSISPTRPGRGLGGALVSALALCAVMAPAPAYAWWGWLEKMSGPRGLKGPQFDVRVWCFGEALPQNLIDEAEALTDLARSTKEENAEPWVKAADAWRKAADAWADALGEKRLPVLSADRKGQADALRQYTQELRVRAPAIAMSTSSVGVAWSLCSPTKLRRWAVDVNWGIWRNDGSPDYAQGEPIHLTTLMTSVSWRLFNNAKYDVAELSAGAGRYWFSSKGFTTLDGALLQPVRLTVRAPSSWSNPKFDDPKEFWKRLASLPVYAIGLTVFPGGFGPADFAGVGDKAVRIPAEALLTQYFFVNVEPLLHVRWKRPPPNTP